MSLLLDETECFRDSPLFRQDLETVEQSAERFADGLRKLAAIAKKCIDAERAANQLMAQLGEEILNMASIDGDAADSETTILSSLTTVSQAMRHLQSHREQWAVDLESALVAPAQRFSTNTIGEMKKLKSKFDSDSLEYENELTKYCGMSKKKDSKNQAEETAAPLRAIKKSFHQSSLTYCSFLNEITSTKKLQFLESMIGFLAGSTTMHTKSARSLEEVSPLLKNLSGNIQESKAFLVHEKKNEAVRINQLVEDGVNSFFRSLFPPIPNGNSMKRDSSMESHSSHSSTSTANSGSKDSLHPRHASEDMGEIKLPLVEMEGYLLKRSSGPIKSWSRRYFILDVRECCLQYISQESEAPIVAVDLIQAVIKEADSDDRRNVLHISNPSVNYYLQAENEGSYYEWKRALIAANQHGPTILETTKLTTGGATNSQAPFLRAGGMARGSIESLDALFEKTGERNTLLKCGELLCWRGAKSLAAIQGSRPAQIPLETTPAAGDWKRVFAALSRDTNLVLFEYEKGASSNKDEIVRPMLTKVMGTIDIASLDPFAIQIAHESVTGKRFSIHIQTRERLVLLSANSEKERDEWFIVLSRLLRNQNFDPSHLRVSASVAVEIHEARNLGPGEYYVEVKADDALLAISSTKKTQPLYWGEEFFFEDIKELDDGIVIILKEKTRSQKDAVIGHCFLGSDHFQDNSFDGWFPLTKGPYLGKSTSSEKEKSDAVKPELKMIVRYRTTDVMPLEKFKELTTFLDTMDLTATFEVTRLSSHLEEQAKNLLKIFLGKGTALAWLKNLVAAEIIQTDNANVMFRANSLATKAIDAYMKVVGMEYLDETIGVAVRTICDSKFSCEVDPTRLTKGDDINQNWVKLTEYVTLVWNGILKSSPDIPKEFRSLFSHIQKTAKQKFGSDNTQYTTVSGFFFLRFFCPAVLTPKLFGLLAEHPDDRTRRTLTLITKTLQCLANLGNFSAKEPFLQPMNEFLVDHTPALKDFINEASTVHEEPVAGSYPVDMERELAHFQQFISSKKNELSSSKSAQIIQLLKLISVLDLRLEALGKASFGAFITNKR